MKAFQAILVIPIASLLLASSSLAKQDKTLAAIKQRFGQAASLEKSGEAHHDVIFNSVLPAVGLQRTRLRFVFKSWQKDPEEDPYLMAHELVKVTIAYNVAASSDHRIEYLYDKRGKLIFHFDRAESEEGVSEVRTYYRAGEPFKLILDEKPAGGGEPSRRVLSKLDKTQRKTAQAKLPKAK